MRGITLIEMAVVMTILAILGALAAPALITTISNARARSMVQKLMADFVWVRNAAATGGAANGGTVATLTINADCSWSASINGVANTAHSMSPQDLAAVTPTISCAQAQGLPITFSFTPQGFASPSAALSYSSSQGQTWSMQVMNSGSILLTNGAS